MDHLLYVLRKMQSFPLTQSYKSVQESLLLPRQIVLMFFLLKYKEQTISIKTCVIISYLVEALWSGRTDDLRNNGGRTCKAVIRLKTSPLMLISTSKSDSFLSASVLAERTSLRGQTYWGKSRTCRDAG